MTRPGGASPSALVPRPLPDPRFGLLAVVIAVLALAASATSLRNGFTYDDRWIIAENGRAHALRPLWQFFGETYWPMKSGAALYRPLAIVAYSVQWVIGDGAPFVFHLVNVLLAAACAVAAFWVATLLVPLAPAFLAAAFFAVHPVHVEAIANVVGQAELWAALVVLLATGLYLRDRRDGLLRRETGVVIWFLFTIGLFIKEHVIVLPALLVAAEVLLFDDDTLWQRLRRLRLLLYPMIVVVAVYLVARVQVTGGVGGDVEHPSLHRKTMLERAFIMLGIFPEYGRLLLWPARLAADYSPRQVTVHAGPDLSQLPGALLLVCGVMLTAMSARRHRVVAFGLVWFIVVIAPVTNILIPTGILLAERTLYLPSFGFLVALSAGLMLLHDRLRRWRPTLRVVVPASCAALVVAGALHSSARNGFWHDTDTAFQQMVEDAPMNFKAHYAMGGQYFEKKLGKEGELEWRLAIALMPTYHGVYMDLAHKYREAHLCGPAIKLYEQALAVEPDLPIARVSLVACQLELAQWRRARSTARQAIAEGFYRRAFQYMIDRADSALVANDSLDPSIGAKWRKAAAP
jgi:hypothetical protein